MKNFKRILKIICVILCVILVESTVRFSVLDYSNRSTSLFLKENRGKITTLFVGASHTLNTINPEVFDKKNNTVSYNCGASASQINIMYFVIKDIIRNNPVNHIILDVTASIFSDSSNVDYLYRISAINHIKSPIIMAQAANDDIGMDNLKDFLFYSKYCITKNQTADNILQNIKTKLKDYANPVVPSNGYDPVTGIQDDYSYDYFFEPESKITSKLSPEKIVYLNKIIELCKEQKIRLDFITIIMPAANIFCDAGYDTVHNTFSDIAQKNNLVYYDFNFYKGRSNIFSEKEDFFDESHLNSAGSEKFMELLTDLYANKNKTDFEDMFYNNSDEMLKEYNF